MREKDYEELLEEIADLRVENKFYVKAINEHKDQIEELEGINEILVTDNDNLSADCQVYEEEWHDTEFQLQCVKDELEEEKKKNKEDVEDEEVDKLITDLLEENEENEDEINELKEYISDLESLADVHRDVLVTQSYIISEQREYINELDKKYRTRCAWFMNV